MTRLAAENLRFAYAEAPVLRGVDLAVAAGELHMVVGPNGSGKSTLLRLLAGLLRPGQGRVLLGDAPIGDLAARELAKGLAYVPQALPARVELTVRELTLLGRTPHQGLLGLESARDAEAADWAMDRTGVAHLAGMRLLRLSGGERQRAFLAKALCQRARFLLLDEPTASLDPAHGLRAMGLVADLCRDQGLGAVVVSHDLNLALRFGHGATLLHQGLVAGQGYPAEVLAPGPLREVYGCEFARLAHADGAVFLAPVPSGAAGPGGPGPGGGGA